MPPNADNHAFGDYLLPSAKGAHDARRKPKHTTADKRAPVKSKILWEKEEQRHERVFTQSVETRDIKFATTQW